MEQKTKRIKKHAKKRFKERYDLKLTKSLHIEIVNKIQNGLATFIERQSNRVTVWLVDDWKVVYDSKRKLIVTVLNF